MRTDVLKGLIYPNKGPLTQANTNFAECCLLSIYKGLRRQPNRSGSLSTHVPLWTLTFSLDDPENLSAPEPQGGWS